MKVKNCYICGAPNALHYFEGRSETITVRGMERRVDNLSGWECHVCADGFWDPDTDSADRHPHLLADAKALAEGADMRGAFTYTVHNDTEALKAS